MADGVRTRTDFSMGDALGAGFRLFRRQPAAVLGWGALQVLLVIAAWMVLLPLLRDMSLMTAGSVEGFEEIQTMMGFQAAAYGLNLVQLVVTLVVWAAAMRATLKPGRPDAFLFLRIGMDELRVGVMALAVFAGLYFFVLVAVVLGIGLGFALYAMGKAALVIGMIVYGVAILAALVVASARLCLLPPAAMITGRFAFEEGWRIGRGRTAKLVGLNLLLLLIYYVVSILFMVAVVTALAGLFVATGGVWPENPQTFDDVLQALKPMAPWALLVLVLAVPFCGWLTAFWAGAVTTAARQLADGVLPAQTVRDGAEASR